MMRAALMLAATAGSPVSRSVVKGPLWLNQVTRQFAHQIEKAPFPTKMNYSYASPEFSAVLMQASEVEEGACSFKEQVHLNHALNRAMNFFAADPVEIRPLDLFRVVLNCRGLPYGSIIMALNTARISYETAKRCECKEKEDLYKTMIEELEDLERVRRVKPKTHEPLESLPE